MWSLPMTRANDPNKLPSIWIQWLSYVLQRMTFWPCMIMCITWYSIFQICLSNIFGLCDFGLWLVTLGFPLMAVEQVEIKFFSCRSQNWHVCNFTSLPLVLYAVHCPVSNSFSPKNSHEKPLKSNFTNMILFKYKIANTNQYKTNL